MSFAARLRKLVSETAIYGISSVVGRLITFLLFPFYSQFFSPDAYGIVGVLFTLFIFANVVFQYGMESAYLKFASEENDDGSARILSTSIWALLSTSVIFALVFLIGRSGISSLIRLDLEWTYLFYYVAAILVLDTMAVVPFAKLRLENRPIRFAVIRLCSVLLNVGLNVYLIAFRRVGIEAIFVANVASSALALILLMPTFAGQLRLTFDTAVLRGLLVFGLPFVPAGLGYAFADRVNIFFLLGMSRQRVLDLYGDAIDQSTLQTLVTQADYGEYMVGVFNGIAKLAIIMALVVQMFRYAWQPFFLQHARDADAKPLFARVFTLFVAVALFVVLGVSFFAQELVALPLPGGRHLIHPSYWLGLFAVPVLLLGYFFQGLYYNFAAGAYIERKTGYFVYCAIAGAAVSIVINVVFVPAYGMIAAAWSAAAAYFTMAALLYILMRRHYFIPYDWSRVLALGACAAITFLLWNRFDLLQHTIVEVLLLAGFLIAIVGLRIVRLSSLRAVLARAKSS
jgi:O-antigen/teichoic acid export membrane protein